MTDQKRTKNNNSVRRTIFIVVAFIAILTFLYTQIGNHPKVVALEINQQNIQKELEEINGQLEQLGSINKELEEINKKLTKLLAENY